MIIKPEILINLENLYKDTLLNNILNNKTFVTILIEFLPAIIAVLISVAFYTVLERQIMAGIQRRQGPNVIGFFGLLQAIADGLKLFLKETILPKSSNLIIFFFAPIFNFGLAMAGWCVIPFGDGLFIANVNISILYIFCLSSLGVHSVIMAGWSSNSKYAFLGSLRSAAQMISYEVSMGTAILGSITLANSLNFLDIINVQNFNWFLFPLLPLFVIFFICTLAETNRHPFDLPEAESELVSGYNVEYSGMLFALFFLAEYSNIIMMCCLSTILFLGGWYSLFLSHFLPDSIIFAIKALFLLVAFVVIRVTYPRYRYDQLMRLGWKIFLPIALCCIVILTTLLISFNNYII